MCQAYPSKYDSDILKPLILYWWELLCYCKLFFAYIYLGSTKLTELISFRCNIFCRRNNIFKYRICSLQMYMCSITPKTAKVSSSYSHMAGPGICHLFSDSSNCSYWSFEAAVPHINTDQYVPIITHHSVTLLVIIQLCSPRCWHRDSNYCRTGCRESRLWYVLSPLLSHLHLLSKLQSDIPLFP